MRANPGNTSSPPNRRTLWVVLLLAALALAVLFVWKSGLAVNLGSRDDIVEWMRRRGPLGPLICIGIQFLQVVLFPFPGEITQVAAGYVFGAWEGFLYSLIGIMLGEAFDFVFARLVGRPVISKLMGGRTLARVDKLLQPLQSRKGRYALFLLFVTPGMPKDAMSYGIGLSQIRLREFMIITGLARTPALLFSTLFGSQLYERNWFTLALIGGVAVLVTVGFYLFEKGQQKRSGTPEPPATTSGEH